MLRHLDEDGVRRFQREARILADLGSHENLAVIYRFAETANGNPCFIMEYVPGGSLADVLADDGSIETKTALSYAGQVARALVHTHARGIVHRDIKPSNVLLAADGQVKLSDFGIAVIRSASATLNAATFEHAAPEVFLNGATKNDERSDLYSLASTLFNLIDGSAPYHIDGELSHEALLHRVLNAPVPVTDRAPQLNRFWTKALAKEPESRFQTAAELVATLTALGRDAPPSPSGPSRKTRSFNPPPPSTPPPASANSTISVTAANGQPLSPQEMAVVDSFATSSSVAQRREVARLTSTQQVLFGLALDPDDGVAALAVPRITDYELLGRLIEPERPKRTRMLAAGRITKGMLAARLADDPDPDVRAALAAGVTDPAIIQRLITDRAESVRAAVIGQIQNPKVLRLIAQSPDPNTRRAIARHIESGELLTTLARDADASVRQVALGRLDPRAILDLAADDDPAISRSACDFVTDSESLYQLSRHANPHVQHNALSRIGDSETLSRIAADLDHPHWPQALAQIDDLSALATLARSSPDPVATAALARIPAGPTLLALANDSGYRFQVQAAERITDPAELTTLAANNDRDVAAIARSRLDEMSERDERLATARMVAIGTVLAAVAVAVVNSSAWPVTLLVIGVVVLAYRAYSSSADS